MKNDTDMPTSVRLFCLDWDESARKELAGTVDWPVGENIDTLIMRIYDPDGFELNFEWGDPNTFAVSWCESREELERYIAERRLPPIIIPKVLTQGQTSISHFLTIHPDTSSQSRERRNHHTLSVSFTIRLIPKPISALKATLKGINQNRISADETLEFILVNLYFADEHGNKIGGLDPKQINRISIESDFVATDKLTTKLNEDKDMFIVKGFEWKDERQHKAGNHFIIFRYKSGRKKLETKVEVIVTPGELKQIKPMIELPENNILDVIRGQEVDIKFRLFDQHNNPIQAKDIEVALGYRKGLDLKQDFGSLIPIRETNDEGIADFGKAILALKSITSLVECPLKTCPFKCFGLIQLGARVIDTAKKGQKPIATIVKFHLTCMRDRPKYFDLKFEDGPNMKAGGLLSPHALTLSSEDGDIFNADPKHVHLKLHGRKTKKSITIEASRDGTSEGKLIFVEQIKVADIYDMEITYADNQCEIKEKLEIALKVNPDKPARLKPNQEIANPKFVSNSSDPQSRIILRDVIFELVDQYDNFIGINNSEEELSHLAVAQGNMLATMEEEDPESKTPIYLVPKFSSNSITQTFTGKHGRVTINTLAIQEDTNGICGKKYVVRLAWQGKNEAVIQPYLIYIVFFKDASKLQEVKELLKEQTKLKNEHSTCEKQFDAILAQRTELRSASDKCLNNLQRLRQELRIPNSELERLDNIRVEQLRCKDLVQKYQEKEADKPNDLMRERALDYPDPNVLGKLVHLAKVEKKQDSLLLSWHMKHVLPCIVTKDSSTAQRIFHETGDMVLSLDSLPPSPSVKELSLPHLTCEKLADREYSGNITLARSLFVELSDPLAQKVIDSLLKNTVIIDTCDKALFYRKILLENGITPPVILTRDRNRITENGIFGGRENSCPKHIETLDAFFLIAASKELQEVKKRLDDLRRLEKATKNYKDAEEEYAVFDRRTRDERLELRSRLESIEARMKNIERSLKKIETCGDESPPPNAKRKYDHDGPLHHGGKRPCIPGRYGDPGNPDPEGDPSVYQYSTIYDPTSGQVLRQF